MKAIFKYDTLWARFWAAFFDIALLGLILKIINTFVVEINGKYLMAILGTMAIYLYRVAMHAVFGRTLGKLVFGLVVLKLDESRIGLRKALLRDIFPLAIVTAYAIIVGPMLVSSKNSGMRLQEFLSRAKAHELVTTLAMTVFYLAWSLTIFISMLRSDTRRSVQDLISGTVIVRERDYGNYGIVLISLLILARFLVFRDIGFGM